MRAFRVLPQWLGALAIPVAMAHNVVHDASFTPDHILRVTYSETPTGCQSRTSVVVNGTIPGPALHILPGARTWIRVFNDMEDKNLTMVSQPPVPGLGYHRMALMVEIALARSRTAVGAFSRRHTLGLPMADPARALLRLRDPDRERRLGHLLLPLPCRDAGDDCFRPLGR